MTEETGCDSETGDSKSPTMLIALPDGPENTEEIQFFEIFSALWQSKWLVMATVLICSAAALASSYLVTKTYRATVLLAPVEDDDNGAMSALSGQLAGIASLAGINFSAQGNSKEAIAILHSREFLSKFIVDKDLLPKLFKDRWDSANDSWNENSAMNPPSPYDGYQRFSQQNFAVSTNKDSGLITVSIEWHDPDEAVDWANYLVNKVNEDLRNRAKDEAQRNLQYLNQELRRTNVVELQQGMYRLIENQINSIMVANVRRDYAFRIIDPAVKPNERDVVKPRRILYLFAGLILGGTIALFVAVYIDRRGGNGSRTELA